MKRVARTCAAKTMSVSTNNTVMLLLSGIPQTTAVAAGRRCSSTPPSSKGKGVGISSGGGGSGVMLTSLSYHQKRACSTTRTVDDEDVDATTFLKPNMMMGGNKRSTVNDFSGWDYSQEASKTLKESYPHQRRDGNRRGRFSSQRGSGGGDSHHFETRGVEKRSRIRRDSSVAGRLRREEEKDTASHRANNRSHRPDMWKRPDRRDQKGNSPSTGNSNNSKASHASPTLNRPTVWLCPNRDCGVVNTENISATTISNAKPTCKQCHTPHPGLTRWHCVGCSAENPPLQTNCWKCNKPRATFWKCGRCNKHNPSSMSTCVNCFAPLSPPLSKPPLDRVITCGSCGVTTVRGADPTPQLSGTAVDMTCPICWVKSSPSQSATATTNTIGNAAVDSAPSSTPIVEPAVAAATAAATATTWSCALCGYQNDQSRVCCEQCLELRSDVDLSATPPPSAFQTSDTTTTAAQAVSTPDPTVIEKSTPTTKQHNATTTTSSSMKAPVVWTCAMCQAENDPSATECSLCGHERGDTKEQSGMKDAPSSSNTSANGAQRQQHQVPKTMHQKTKPATSSSFSSRTKKKEKIPSKVLQNGHWGCNHCGRDNTPWVQSCSGCGQNRVLGPEVKICSTCFSPNNAIRRSCKQCGAKSFLKSDTNGTLLDFATAAEEATTAAAVVGETPSSFIPMSVTAGAGSGDVDSAIRSVLNEESMEGDPAATKAEDTSMMMACEEVTTWNCVECKFENHIESATCLKCSASRPAKTHWRCPCSPLTFRTGHKCTRCDGERQNIYRCRVCHEPNSETAHKHACKSCGTDPAESTRKKQCSACGTVNDGEEADFCTKCDALLLTKVWVCGGCTAVNTVTTVAEGKEDSCSTCNKRRSESDKVLSSFWRCPGCGDRKHYTQSWCSGCQISITEHVRSKNTSSAASSPAKVSSSTSSSIAKGTSRYFPDINFWKCKGCQRTNFDFEPVCKTCSMPRPSQKREAATGQRVKEAHQHQRQRPSLDEQQQKQQQQVGTVIDDRLFHNEVLEDDEEEEGIDYDSMPEDAEFLDLEERTVSLTQESVSASSSGAESDEDGVVGREKSHEQQPKRDPVWVCTVCGERNEVVDSCGCCGMNRV